MFDFMDGGGGGVHNRDTLPDCSFKLNALLCAVPWRGGPGARYCTPASPGADMPRSHAGGRSTGGCDWVVESALLAGSYGSQLNSNSTFFLLVPLFRTLFAENRNRQKLLSGFPKRKTVRQLY